MQERTVDVGTVSTFDLHVLRNALAVYSDYTKDELESGALSASDRECIQEERQVAKALIHIEKSYLCFPKLNSVSKV